MADEYATIVALKEFNQPLELVEVPLPQPEPGAILVEMDVATMCGSEVHHHEGWYEGIFEMTLPVCVGHEGVGRVLKLGPGAEVDSIGQPLSVGDRLVYTHEPCGHCYYCQVTHEETLCPDRRLGMYHNISTFPYVAGTFGTHGYVWPRAGRLRVPAEVESEWASAASCAMRTVVAAIEKAGRIDYTKAVVVQGAGPLGLFATAILSTLGPRRLIVVGGPDDRLELARAWGATDVVSIERHPDPADRVILVRELTEGRGPDVIFELAGSPGAVAEGLEMAGRGCTYVVAGTAAGPAQSVVPHNVTVKELTVRGSMGASIDSYWKSLEFLRRHRDRFDWSAMLTGRYRLGEVTDAIHKMKSGQEIKPVVLTQEL